MKGKLWIKVILELIVVYFLMYALLIITSLVLDVSFSLGLLFIIVITWLFARNMTSFASEKIAEFSRTHDHDFSSDSYPIPILMRKTAIMLTIILWVIFLISFEIVNVIMLFPNFLLARCILDIICSIIYLKLMPIFLMRIMALNAIIKYLKQEND